MLERLESVDLDALLQGPLRERACTYTVEGDTLVLMASQDDDGERYRRVATPSAIAATSWGQLKARDRKLTSSAHGDAQHIPSIPFEPRGRDGRELLRHRASYR